MTHYQPSSCLLAIFWDIVWLFENSFVTCLLAKGAAELYKRVGRQRFDIRFLTWPARWLQTSSQDSLCWLCLSAAYVSLYVSFIFFQFFLKLHLFCFLKCRFDKSISEGCAIVILFSAKLHGDVSFFPFITCSPTIMLTWSELNCSLHCAVFFYQL